MDASQASVVPDESTSSSTHAASGSGLTTAELFPDLHSRTFFCSALVAAGLKVMGVLPADANDNYFWPGSFARGEQVDKGKAHIPLILTYLHVP